jgi:hypothetical protein
MPTKEQLETERALRDADDAFARANPHDATTGARLAETFTAMMVSMLNYYVRNWGLPPGEREPMLDISNMPSHAEVASFLTDAQRDRVDAANAPLLALQEARYGEGDFGFADDEREDG